MIYNNIFRLSAFSLIILLTVVLTACGDDSNGSTASGSYTATISGAVEAEFSGGSRLQHLSVPDGGMRIHVGVEGDITRTDRAIHGLLMQIDFYDGVPTVGERQLNAEYEANEGRLEQGALLYIENQVYAVRIKEGQTINIDRASSSEISGDFTIDIEIRTSNTEEYQDATLSASFTAPKE